MAQDEDAALFLLVKGQGDKAAFAKLFDKHQASVVRFAFRFVGSRARAEELAQDIFVKLYKSVQSYQPHAKFKTFLFRVATNHCLNEVRRPDHAREETAPPPQLEASGPLAEQPDQVLEGKELEEAVSRGLRAMSDRERAAFSMCRFEGLAYKDIALALAASEPAVKSLIHRATQTMLKELEAFEASRQPEESAP